MYIFYLTYSVSFLHTWKNPACQLVWNISCIKMCFKNVVISQTIIKKQNRSTHIFTLKSNIYIFLVELWQTLTYADSVFSFLFRFPREDNIQIELLLRHNCLCEICMQTWAHRIRIYNQEIGWKLRYCNNEILKEVLHTNDFLRLYEQGISRHLIVYKIF